MEKIFNKKVKDVMTENPIYSNINEGVVKAFEILLKHKISCLPVLDENNKLVGIITSTDIGYNLIIDKYTMDTKVSEVMTTNVITISPENTLFEAIQKMDEYGHKKEIINQLPVVDENNNLIGIISDGDIIRELSKNLNKKMIKK